MWFFNNFSKNKISLDMKYKEKSLTKTLNKKKYFYESFKIKKINLAKKFSMAKKNYFDTLKKLNIKNNWMINFYLYDNLKLENNKINKKISLKSVFSLTHEKYKNKSNFELLFR